MTDRYVGIGGNDGNSGLTWALRKLTLNGVEDTPVVAGDHIYVGPGVYRELLTVDVSGGNTYSTGTVSVTNGSTTVEGSGTTFTGGNVSTGYEFYVRLAESGSDGVANGTSTFTAAGGNFQTNHVGMVIQINTKGAYAIATRVSATEITLSDVNSLGWPSADTGLSYSVMSGQGHYEIASITDSDTLELKKPWAGPTLTGLAYLTFNPIRYIGDVTGENTDGVGGIVRVTGSNNDQAAARANCITANGFDYRALRGFMLDITSSHVITLTNPENWAIEDCWVNTGPSGAGIYVTGTDQSAVTIRRCIFPLGVADHVYFHHSSTVDDTGHLVENCVLIGTKDRGARSDKVGGITVKNTDFFSCGQGIRVVSAVATGQTITARNCCFEGCGVALMGTTFGDITEDYNTFYGNSGNRTNTETGANSLTYPLLLLPPILLGGYKFPWWFGELSEWSQIAAIAGANGPTEDLLGIPRPATASKNSWGPMQFCDKERETGTTYDGSAASIVLHDAGRHQIWVPVTNTSTTISVRVQRQANYAGNLPQMIIKQPGQVDDVTTDVAAASQWNLLTTTLTPAADPPYVIVELVSRNTNGANDEVFFDKLAVS